MYNLISIIYFFTLNSQVESMMSTEQFIFNLSTVSSNITHYKYILGPHLRPGVNSSIIFKCRSLFHAALATVNSTWPPPRQIPYEFQNHFAMNGDVPIRSLYFDNTRQNGGKGYTWKMSDVILLGNQKSTCGGYKMPECYDTITKYKHLIANKTGYVFGSQNPWAESALLAAGASTVTTVEYMSIVSTHPNLITLHPSQIAKKYLNRALHPADFAWSYSSFEHDGLGRYGDPINPVGDIESIARVHCLLKRDGILFLSVPIGIDAVEWNAHRIYGPHRLRLVLSNWKLLDVIGAVDDIFHVKGINQPILVLMKKEIEHSSHHMVA